MAVYTVSQVSQHVKEVLESDPLLADVLVEGEVSNLRVSSAGHSYFSLKDDQALLNCVMFRGQPGAELLAGGTNKAFSNQLSGLSRRREQKDSPESEN